MKELKMVLQQFPEYWQGEDLQRFDVVQDIENKKPSLVSALLNNEKIKEQYCINIDGVLLFDYQKLISLIQYKEYWQDSFTKYKNKVGLTTGGQYLDYSSDVVLDFPFKDCVLEGGMTKSEVGKAEVFYNEIIAADEIDRLFSPKVLTKAVRYEANGKVEPVVELNDKDNLIIKGNNLLALHSIKERFRGAIDCIFIDPPYYFIKQKPEDSFLYNSNFKLSSWLVFLQNRLAIAKELLSDNGVIFITMSDDGAHYLKILADNIFGKENFIADVIWQSRKSVSSDTLISLSSNHVLTYAKNKEKINKKDFKHALDVERFDKEDERGKYKIAPFDAPNVRKNLSYEIKNPNTGEIYLPPEGRCWSVEEHTFKQMLTDGTIMFGVDGTARPQVKIYLEDAIKQGKGETSKTLWNDVAADTIIWSQTDTTTNATKHQKAMFGKEVFKNPKPENLIQRALELATDENSIVLDFFLGSGTTAAVAHKMGRQYIGIEQLDYIETIPVERLKKVIDGEPGGISESVAWQGGGSFVYFELAKLNQSYVDLINKSENCEELLQLLDTMKSEAYLNYQVELEKILNGTHEIDDVDQLIPFVELPLTEQKKLLLALLDKNQLYVNLSEINDVNMKISDADKQFTKSFYKKGA